MIVLDDLGFADLGCYGSAIRTPNVDRLAQGGLRSTNFHVTAICSPTRACLLTGRNHHRVGMGYFPDLPIGFPGYTGRIPPSAATLPRLLRDSGYSTFAVGKWHLTPRPDRTAAGPFDLWPLGVGFERYYGFLGAMTNQWAPDLARDNGFVDPPAGVEDGYHLTADLASQAIRFVQDQQQAAPDKPFFLYFATGATHSPHHVGPEWAEPYRHQFDDGWESLRRTIFARQQDLGVVPPDTVPTDRPEWISAWDRLSADERRVFARQMEVYAGFLAHTDAQIGRVVDFLTDIGALDNTIIMVLSDNGASAEGGPQGLLSTAPDLASMLSQLEDLGGPRGFNQYAWGWAWAGNTPFRLWKRYAWLGGVRVPLIVHWPAGIAAKDNSQVNTQFCHAVDLMPTILAAARVDVPDTVDGLSQLTLDGASILPAFSDTGSPGPRATQYFEAIGSRAIYRDGWKATTNHVDSTIPAERELIPGSHDFDTDRWSLFHLDSDFAESNDLAGSQPELLRELVDLWWHEAERNQVLPLIDGQHSEGRESAMDPPVYPDRRDWVYRPGAGPIINTNASHLGGFRLLADIEVGGQDTPSGVIFAHRMHSFGGTRPEGWVCYVLEGVLAVALTVGYGSGATATKVAARNINLLGRQQVEITYTPDPDADAVLRVAVDGHEAATARIPASRAVHTSNPLEDAKLSVGRDIIAYRFSDEYEPPFPFTGRIHRVTYTLPPAEPKELSENIEEAMRLD